MMQCEETLGQREPLLTIRNLSIRFEKRRTLGDVLSGRSPQTVSALNGIDLDVSPGETLGIVGESGCGKSTLARCIVGLHRPTEGTISYDGRVIAELRGRERRAYNRRVQMIFQDPYTSLNPRMTVREVLREAIAVHALRRSDGIDRRVNELLDLVRLPKDASAKYPHEFSGGQRQRIAIARALALEPTCLVADELVSALDVSVQAQVVNLLLELQTSLGLTVLFVAHDLRLVRHVSHRVAVIYLGTIVELGPSAAVFSRPRHPYSRALLSAAPSLDPRARTDAPAIVGELPSPLDIPRGCPFNTRCGHAEERCRLEKPRLRNVEGSLVACHFAEAILPLSKP